MPQAKKPDRKKKASRLSKPKGRAALQLKVVLLGSEPLVWRRILVPGNSTFWDLHMAIQDAMGWMNCHLHVFTDNIRQIPSQIQIGIPDPEYGDPANNMQPGWEIGIKQFFEKPGDSIQYVYDFGDGWQHEIEFEGRVETTKRLPQCLDGARACPPEDCGGLGRFGDIVRGDIDDEFREWLGDYDPARFDPRRVGFTNPTKALKKMLDG